MVLGGANPKTIIEARLSMFSPIKEKEKDKLLAVQFTQHLILDLKSFGQPTLDLPKPLKSNTLLVMNDRNFLAQNRPIKNPKKWETQT